MLLGQAVSEISRVRKCHRQVEAARQLSANLSHQYTKSAAKLRVAVFSQRPDVLEGLDNFEGLETRWWIVCGVGAALSAAGVISLVANWKCGFQHGDYIIGGSNRRFRFPSSAFHKFASSGRTRPGFILVAMVFLALCLLINLGQDSDARVAFQSTEIPELISKLPASVSPTALRFYSRIAEGISPIRVPYNPGSGPWIILENAMHGFAVTNGITIVRFEGAGTTTAYVWVSNRDAEAMRKFVRSMGQSANQRLQPAAR